jgi:hypothetical protein
MELLDDDGFRVDPLLARLGEQDGRALLQAAAQRRQRRGQGARRLERARREGPGEKIRRATARTAVRRDSRSCRARETRPSTFTGTLGLRHGSDKF